MYEVITAVLLCFVNVYNCYTFYLQELELNISLDSRPLYHGHVTGSLSICINDVNCSVFFFISKNFISAVCMLYRLDSIHTCGIQEINFKVKQLRRIYKKLK